MNDTSIYNPKLNPLQKELVEKYGDLRAETDPWGDPDDIPSYIQGRLGELKKIEEELGL